MLSPAVGVTIDKPRVRRIAEAAGVTRAPRADALAEQLPQANEKLAVALAVEYAGCLQADENRLPVIQVPNSQGTVDPAEEVYIDDDSMGAHLRCSTRELA